MADDITPVIPFVPRFETKSVEKIKLSRVVSNGSQAKREQPVFDGSEFELLLVCEREFEEVVTELELNTGQDKFTWWRKGLSSTARDTWDRILTGYSEDMRTNENFQAAMVQFKRKYCTADSRANQIAFLENVKKPPTMTVQDFVARIQKIQMYLNRIPSVADEQLSPTLVKNIIFRAMPKSWHCEFLRKYSGAQSATLQQLQEFMMNEKTWADQPGKKGGRSYGGRGRNGRNEDGQQPGINHKRKWRGRNYNPNFSNKKPRNQKQSRSGNEWNQQGGKVNPQTTCPIHGGHKWIECRDNPYGPAYVPRENKGNTNTSQITRTNNPRRGQRNSGYSGPTNQQGAYYSFQPGLAGVPQQHVPQAARTTVGTQHGWMMTPQGPEMPSEPETYFQQQPQSFFTGASYFPPDCESVSMPVPLRVETEGGKEAHGAPPHIYNPNAHPVHAATSSTSTSISSAHIDIHHLDSLSLDPFTTQEDADVETECGKTERLLNTCYMFDDDDDLSTVCSMESDDETDNAYLIEPEYDFAWCQACSLHIEAVQSVCGPTTPCMFYNSLHLHQTEMPFPDGIQATDMRGHKTWIHPDSAVPSTILMARTIQKQPSKQLFKVLLDGGSDYNFIHQRCLPPGSSPQVRNKIKRARTLAGELDSSREVWLSDVVLPEFTKSKTITGVQANVFQADCSYDMILGRAFLLNVGIDTSFSSRKIIWDGVELDMKPKNFWNNPTNVFLALEAETNDETSLPYLCRTVASSSCCFTVR